MITVIALQAHDRRCGGAGDTHALVTSFVEPLAENTGPSQSIAEVIAAHEDIGERGIGRVMHPAPKTKLLFVKADEIVLRRVLDGVVILKVCLKNDFAGRLAATGATGDLGQKLERAFRGAEIGQAESDIGSDNAD